MGTQRAERTASGRPQARHKFTYCHGEARRRAEGRKIHCNRESLSAAPPRQRHASQGEALSKWEWQPHPGPLLPLPSTAPRICQAHPLTSSLLNSEAQQPLRPAALSGEASPLPPPHHQRLPGRAQATNEHLTEGALSRTGSSPSAPEGAKAAPPAVHHPPSRAPTARWDRGPGDTGPLHPQST